jgi:uncharacterized protein YkwD
MTNCPGASASGSSAGSGPALSLFVRRATIAAALLAVPVVAAFAISAGASAAPATSAGAITSAQEDNSDALIDTQSAVFNPGGATVTEVKYTKKKKKVVKKKPAVVAPARTTKAPPTPPSKTTSTESSSHSSALESLVINLTNAQRLANGCGAMHTDNRLTAAALAHSADMVTHNYFDHTGSDGSDFVAREVTAGYARNNAAAENIAWGYPTAQAVVDAWMASPGHRANILNCANVAVGVGLAKKADGTSYWTQDFGRV